MQVGQSVSLAWLLAATIMIIGLDTGLSNAGRSVAHFGVVISGHYNYYLLALPLDPAMPVGQSVTLAWLLAATIMIIGLVTGPSNAGRSVAHFGVVISGHYNNY